MGDPDLKYDNQAISVDCVVFGFDGRALKALLIKRRRGGQDADDWKLPGSLIADAEDLEGAALRVMTELTGLGDVRLRQMEVFSDPRRVEGEELQWINDYYKVRISRVVTVVFYAMVKLDERLTEYTARKNARWVDLHEVKRLALDHNRILIAAMDFVMQRFQQEPVAFEMLPRKFTIRQLQNLYEAVLGIEIDNRNFRKKILSQGYIIPLDEKESGVAHKPAQLYRFDRKIYERKNKVKFKLNFLH